MKLTAGDQSVRSSTSHTKANRMVPDTVATRSCEYQKYRKAGIARTSRMGPFGLAGASATSTVATGSSFRESSRSAVSVGRVRSGRVVRLVFSRRSPRGYPMLGECNQRRPFAG